MILFRELNFARVTEWNEDELMNSDELRIILASIYACPLLSTSKTRDSTSLGFVCLWRKDKEYKEFIKSISVGI
ncbi:hypothetical protein SUGI_0765640 [Cryptomeria japonica]|nr:hypothetical protein SUGI_0765640 [Cryptomeria japonica]